MAEERLTSPVEPPASVELRSLVKQAQAGDVSALPRIRKILDAHPEVWKHLGDLSALAERAWIAVLADDNPLVGESMKRTVESMKVDLAGENSTRLEQMMVEQVIACWLEVACLQTVSAPAGSSSLEQSNFKLKRLESAQKRFESAVKTLTTLRTLLPIGVGPAPSLRLHAEPKNQRA